MRISRFHIDSNIETGSNVALDSKDYKYIAKVLRLEVGDKINIFNKSGEYSGTIISITNKILVEVEEKLPEKKSSDISMTLFQGIIKLSKFEEVVEKCTELGVNSIIPIECEYSQVKSKEIENKRERLETIIKAATLQCERSDFPKLEKGINFSEIQSAQYDLILIASIERNPEENLIIKNINAVLKTAKAKNIAIVIGPEGGFSPKEHLLAKSLNFEFVSLNYNILRAETAAITGVGVIRSYFD